MDRCPGSEYTKTEGFVSLCIPLIICLTTFKIVSNDGNLRYFYAPHLDLTFLLHLSDLWLQFFCNSKSKCRSLLIVTTPHGILEGHYKGLPLVCIFTLAVTFPDLEEV